MWFLLGAMTGVAIGVVIGGVVANGRSHMAILKSKWRRTEVEDEAFRRGLKAGREAYTGLGR